MNWQDYFMKMAYLVASKSKDPSRQVGCIIVGPDKEIRSTGFNGFPRRVREFSTVSPETLSVRWERPAKYQWVEHSERNAIYNAARMGIPLKGCTAYITLAPCAACTRALIQAGITVVYGPAFVMDSSTKDYGFETSIAMLQEAGIKYIEVSHAKEDTT